MGPLSDLVGSSQFAIGLLVGTIALLITLPVALALRAFVPRKGRRPGLVGPAFAAGGVVALDGLIGTDELLPVPGAVPWGLLLLWAGGAIASRTSAPAVVGPLAALPGALLVAGANRGLDAGWVPVVMVLGTVLIGAGAADLDRRSARLGIAPVLLAVAILGIYFTVPDTENMRAMVGLALPLVLLAWPYTAAALGGGGAYAAIGLLLWIVPIDGIGRPGAIVGAVGAFGLLALEPVGRALAPWLASRVPLHRVPVTRPRTVFVVGQLVVTIYASRVAGMAQEGWVAALALVPAVAAGLAFGAIVALPERRRHGKRRRNGTRTPRASAPAGPRSPSSQSPTSPAPPGAPTTGPATPPIRTKRLRPRPNRGPNPGPGPNGWTNGHSNGNGAGHG